MGYSLQIYHFAGETIFKIGEHSAKLQAKCLIVIRPISLTLLFVLQDAEVAR